MTQPTEFLPGIFVGDHLTASDPDFFRRQNIVRVVNCTNSIPCYFPNVDYFRIPVDDAGDDVNNNVMAAYIPAAIKFVLKPPLPGKRSGVLIHCQAGVSRSCTVAVAVLRWCCQPTIRDAITTLLAKRDIAFVNGRYFNFEKALLQVFRV